MRTHYPGEDPRPDPGHNPPYRTPYGTPGWYGFYVPLNLGVGPVFIPHGDAGAALLRRLVDAPALGTTELAGLGTQGWMSALYRGARPPGSTYPVNDRATRILAWHRPEKFGHIEPVHGLAVVAYVTDGAERDVPATMLDACLDIIGGERNIGGARPARRVLYRPLATAETVLRRYAEDQRESAAEALTALADIHGPGYARAYVHLATRQAVDAAGEGDYTVAAQVADNALDFARSTLPRGTVRWLLGRGDRR